MIMNFKHISRVLTGYGLASLLAGAGAAHAATPVDDEGRDDFESVALAAEDENTVTLLGGLGLALSGENGFADKHSQTSIFFGTAAVHHYFRGDFALGLDYTYLGSHSGRDLLRCHFVGVDLRGRVLMEQGRNALFFGLAPGWMHYADKTRQDNGRFAVFNKGYFATKFSLGYEIALSRRLAAQVRTDILSAAWYRNENYQLFGSGDDYYIDKYGHLQRDDSNNLFEPSLVMFSLNVGLSYRF